MNLLKLQILIILKIIYTLLAFQRINIFNVESHSFCSISDGILIVLSFKIHWKITSHKKLMTVVLS